MGIFAPDETAVIRAHRFDTVCSLVATEQPCRTMAQGRADAVKGRTLRLLGPGRLLGRLPASWMMAVLHCPGEDLQTLASWARRLPLADQHRIKFYEPESFPAADAARALRPWMEAGLPAPVRQRFANEAELNQVLGNDLNWRILEDHAEPA